MRARISMVGVLMLIALSAGAAGLAAPPDGGDNDRSLPTSLKPPLKCADLAAPDVFVASYYGAHSHLRFRDEAGVPALRWRQFSDWGNGNLFDEVLVARPAESPDAVAARTGYRWRPDFVDVKSQVGDLLQVQSRVAYVNRDSILAVVTLTNLADRETPVVLYGRTSGPAQAAVSRQGDGYRITVDRSIRNLRTESRLRLDFAALCDGVDATTQPEGASYGWRVSVGPSERRRVVFVLTTPEHLAAAARWLADPTAAVGETTAAVDRWLAEAARPQLSDDRLLRTYYRSWYLLWFSVEHAEGLWTRPIITPSKSEYGRGIWLWDAAFHVFALVTGGPQAVQLAEDQVMVLVENGERMKHLPREVWVGEAGRGLQAPGALTWAAVEVFRKTHDREFLARVYPLFGRNNRWWYEQKDSDRDGLCEWAREDSGWDVSPRWARGEVNAIDLNCWLYLDQQLLARMATMLGKHDEAADWRRRAARTKRLIRDNLWHQESGLYLDRHPDGDWITAKTPATYWAMLTGIASKAQADRMAAYLRDPRGFGTTWPLPTVAADERAYAPGSYANGSVLINVNWLTLIGLKRYHYHELADWLARKTLDLVARESSPREYYHPETGEGVQAQGFNWSGALFVRIAHDYRFRSKPAT